MSTFKINKNPKKHLGRTPVEKPDDTHGAPHNILEIVNELAEKYKLTRDQRTFLLLRLRHSSDLSCIRSMGGNTRMVETWKSKSKNNMVVHQFHLAYDEFFKRFEALVEADMGDLMGKALNRVEELLDAEKTLVTDDGIIRLPDYETRFKGLQALFHYLGRWGKTPNVEVNPVHVTISEQFSQLLELKKNQKALNGSVDGEFREVKDNG